MARCLSRISHRVGKIAPISLARCLACFFRWPLLGHAIQLGMNHVQEGLQKGNDHRPDENADRAQGLRAAQYTEQSQERVEIGSDRAAPMA